MRAAAILLAGLMTPGLAHAVDCSIRTVSQALPIRPTVIAPIASELIPASSQLGAPGSVLSQAYDEAQSVDQVLLRLRIEGCRNVAMAMPAPAPTGLDPNDPATYKKRTEFDNAPWRFDMSQNGKRMTADEFSAWMKARGVRVARGATPAATTVPAPAPSGQPPGLSPFPTTAPPAPMPAPAPQPSPPPEPPRP